VVPNNALSRQSRRQKATQGLAGWPLRSTAGDSGSVHHLTELRTSAPGLSRLKDLAEHDCSLVCSPSRVRQLHWSESVQSSATLDQRSIDRARPIAGANGNLNPKATLACATSESEETALGRGLLLWLIGIPIPIILLIWLFGGLH
jgi:hypothetical protein